MKTVLTSNYADETVEEKVLEHNLTEKEARAKADKWNNEYFGQGGTTYFCSVKEDDYVVWRGLADLVGDDE